jgi:hypothetical protein
MVLKKTATPQDIEPVNIDKITELVANNNNAGLRSIAQEYVPENTFAKQ